MKKQIAEMVCQISKREKFNEDVCLLRRRERMDDGNGWSLGNVSKEEQDI